MAVMFSKQVIEAMGFHQISEGTQVTAVFHSVHVYEVRGITVAEDAVLSSPCEISGIKATVAIGHSINKLAQAIVADDYADNEADWAKERKCTPPYVLIRFGPTESHTAEVGHMIKKADRIETYDSFSAAKDELLAIERKALPSIITALACAFNTSDHKIQFRPVDRLVYGLTPDKVMLHDFRISGNASLLVSRRLPTDKLQTALNQTVSLAPQVKSKVARFHHLALTEEDALKKFLYFFVSIEIETHKTFSSIDPSVHLARLLNNQDRVRMTAPKFFEGRLQEVKNLRDKFTWCALCVWTHMVDSDIEQFKRLKDIRDDIAHGTIAEPPRESVEEVERLASKLQLRT